jgi:tripartite-type tricarboxylate transporter receptor subunit TctC
MFRRRGYLHIAIGIAAILFSMPALSLDAAEFPDRPVTFLCPYPPGGAADAGVRILANVAQKYLGQPIVVENKIGASGQICADYLARQRPDGYTLAHLFYSQTHPENFTYFRQSTSTSKDFRVVAQWTNHPPAVVVRADDPFNSLKDLVEYTKKNPELPYAPGGGKGNFFHVTMTVFAEKAGIKLVDVPTKGESEIITQLLGGHLRVGMGNISFFAPYIVAGKIKAIALLAEQRTEEFPDLPTFKDQGYDVGMGDIYLAAYVPAKTPEPVVAKLRDAIKKTCLDPEFIAGMKPVGTPITYCDGEAMEKKTNDVTAVIVRVFKQFGYLQ